MALAALTVAQQLVATVFRLRRKAERLVPDFLHAPRLQMLLALVAAPAVAEGAAGGHSHPALCLLHVCDSSVGYCLQFGRHATRRLAVLLVAGAQGIGLCAAGDTFPLLPS